MTEVVNIKQNTHRDMDMPDGINDVKIFFAQPLDFDGIIELLNMCRFDDSVDPRSLGGVHFVAKHEEKIVGYIWALIGDGKIAYIDFLCVHPDYRSKGIIHHKKISLLLCEHMRGFLNNYTGIDQFIYYLSPLNIVKLLS